MKNPICALCCVLLLISCTKNEDSPQQVQTLNVTQQESLALRISLQEIKDMNSAKFTGRTHAALCFNFDYPIIVSYNDDSETNITTFEQLLDLLLAETNTNHIVGIGFPFDVILPDGSMQTIANETEFQTLVSNCGYDTLTVAQVIQVVGDCFTVNYPISFNVDGVLKSFDNQQEVEDYFKNNPVDFKNVKFSYPFSVMLVSDNSNAAINDDFELVQLITETCGIE